MNTATLVYLPPDGGKFHTSALLKNLHDNPASGRVITYSDSMPCDVKIDSPDKLARAGNKYAMNNCAFLFALYIAKDQKLDYFLYLEEDVRVFGRGWDAELLSQVEGKKDVLAGTPVIWNYMGGDLIWRKRAIECSKQFMDYTGIAPGFYGWNIPGRVHEPYIYPNGAIGIYPTDFMYDLFIEFHRDIGRYAVRITAWDLEIGLRLFRKYGDNAWNHFMPLARSYSGFQDDTLNAQQRMDLLRSKRVVAVHQIKSDWIP